MPISHEHRCFFIHIPKTGGTSVENALGMYFRSNRENVDRLFGAIRSSELKQLAATASGRPEGFDLPPRSATAAPGVGNRRP